MSSGGLLVRAALISTFLTFAVVGGAMAQTFSSGSTGADGTLDLTAGDRTVQLPESGS